MKRLLVGCVVVILSLAMIALSFARSFPVYEEDLSADEFAVYEDIPEYELTSDATFAGVRVSSLTGRFITTYDRSQPRGRKACPT